MNSVEKKFLGATIGAFGGWFLIRNPEVAASAINGILEAIIEREVQRRLEQKEAEVVKLRSEFTVIDGGLAPPRPKKHWWQRLLFWRKS